MILPDVNVLIYAFRKESAHHAVSRSWLDRTVLGDARFALSRMTLSALVRITTNPRTYPSPSAVEEAFAFCEDLLNQPHCVIVEPGPDHWNIFRHLCLRTNTRAGRVTDAWYAALAIEWGCEWITFDRDFARFPGLKWQLPSPE